MAQFPESTKTLRGHDLYLGSLLFLNKTAPSPRFRANLYLDYNVHTGRLIIPPELEKTLKKLDTLLMGVETKHTVKVFESEDDLD